MATTTDNRDAEVSALLVGAIDLHCHSGPAAMPRILDHHEALMDCANAKFSALLYKDHFYLGVSHAMILEKLFPETGVKLFSGIALNNANGGINPHAVNHAINIGAKIVWMPTLSAANHIEKSATEAKNFPKTAKKMLDPIPLSALDANGELSDDTKQVLDLIAEGDIILAGGHLPASELHMVFAEAKKRGVKKMLVNHPTYIVGCTDEDIRQMVRMGVYMEHSICMFVEGKVAQIRSRQARAPDRGRGRRPHGAVLGPRPAGLAAPGRRLSPDRAAAARPAVLRGRHPHDDQPQCGGPSEHGRAGDGKEGGLTSERAARWSTVPCHVPR